LTISLSFNMNTSVTCTRKFTLHFALHSHAKYANTAICILLISVPMYRRAEATHSNERPFKNMIIYVIRCTVPFYWNSPLNYRTFAVRILLN